MFHREQSGLMYNVILRPRKDYVTYIEVVSFESCGGNRSTQKKNQHSAK